MSTFEGSEFLSSYEISRLNVIKKIETNIECSRIIKKLSEQEIDSVEEIITESRLLSVILELNSNSSNETDKFIQKLIKKFEISKKLFISYDLNLKENTNNYKTSRNYILLAIICIKKYEKTDNLKFINTLLKLNDIICSVFTEINNENDLCMMKYILEKELELISSLKKGALN
jgi:hypothetical protein|tara:strand:+ start:348 stop:869 length:522 start_codon:yes stop_codon:yes gene_type:complete